MIADVKKLLNARPLVPFTIVTTGGSRYKVPTYEHGGIDPATSRIVVWSDDGAGIIVPGLHIASIDQEKVAS